MGGAHGLLEPGNFRLSLAAGGLLAAPGDYSRQLLRLAATTAS